MSRTRIRPPQASPGSDPIQGSALALQPEALRAFLKLYGVLWSHGEVDPITKEIARIRNARTIDCAVCKSIRFASARAAGLSEDVVDQIRDGFEDGGFSDAHKAVLRFVDAFLRTPGELDPVIARALEEHFTPAQIVELAAGVALFMGFSKIAVSLGGLPEQIPVHEEPTPDWPAA
jgi:alkylhydroperoxidase family enzyme